MLKWHLIPDARAGPRQRKSSTRAGEAPPHELAMRPLPAYRIEPPDVIQIEMLKLVPLPPYRAEIYDVLQIHANGLPDQPIDNDYHGARPTARSTSARTYGSVHVAGKTNDEMTAALNKWLATVAPRAGRVTCNWPGSAGVQPVTGQYLVGPDGTINLRHYGMVPMSGKTVAEARIAIQNHLKQFLDSPEVSVNVVAYNSKVYYIITQGAGLGDNVRRLPITGNETVLDAISQINGLSKSPARISGSQDLRPRTREGERSSRRLGRHYRPRGDGHQLPDLPRRSGLHRRGPAGYANQFARQEDGPRRADDGNCWLDHFHPQHFEAQLPGDEAVPEGSAGDSGQRHQAGGEPGAPRERLRGKRSAGTTWTTRSSGRKRRRIRRGNDPRVSAVLLAIGLTLAMIG